MIDTKRFYLLLAIAITCACSSFAIAQPMPDDGPDRDFGTNTQTQTAQSRHSVMDHGHDHAGHDHAGHSHTNNGTSQSLGPLEMVLDDNLIESFKRKGQLSALIEPRQYVNEIQFIYARNENENHDHEVTGVMTPVSKTGNILSFELTDFDIQTIKQKGLRYRFDQFERGRFEAVRVDYRSAGNSNANRIDSNRSNNQFSNPPNRDNQVADNGFSAPPNRNQQPRNFLPTPSPDYSEPGDSDFMGPTMQPISRPPPRDTATQQAGNQFDWEPNPRPGNQTNTFGNQSNSFGNSFGQTNQFQSSDTSADELAAAQQRQRLLDQRRAQLLQQQQQLEEQELASIERQNQLRQQDIERRERQLAEERQQAEWERRNSFQPFANTSKMNESLRDRVASSNRNYSDTLADGFGADTTRTASNVSPQPTRNQGVASLKASIDGPDSSNRRNSDNNNPPLNKSGIVGDTNSNSTEGILYFMLWFSLGLNVYLGWIARGFYVRYYELADELRETFTATM